MLARPLLALVLSTIALGALAAPALGSEDFSTSISQRLPYVIGFVLALTLVVLLPAFRSLAVALTAIALNLLSVGTANGLLVLMF